MNKEKTFKSRVLAWILTFTMVLSMTPITVFAEVNEAHIGCTHVHDESCGYVEAVAEVSCDKECTDTDGDGVINHAEDCAYRPAIEEQECTHVHDENCGGVSENNSEGNVDETESDISEKIKTLQGRINALPTSDQYKTMTENEQEAIYEEAVNISDEYSALSTEEQKKVDIERLEALFSTINDGIEAYSNDSTVTFLNSGYPYGKNMDSSSITLVIEV